MLLPWSIALFVVSLGQWIWYRWGQKRIEKTNRTASRIVGIAWAVLAVVAGGGALVVVILAGESGARAVWG
jgi:hypothetical protein